MLFPERPITLDHIRQFCTTFNEGLRVEYKSTFDQNVRDNLPKIISSFANSQGGVLVIGVNTLRGEPQPPFDGFATGSREELPLTIENICLRKIHPPVLPRTAVVASDVADRQFAIVEVEESGEAPHTIENSKKVYVRTGNASNPYDLAEVDLVIDLVKRRTEPVQLRDRLVKHAEERVGLNVMHGAPFGQISISPLFPRSALCASRQVWDFLAETRYRGGSFFPRQTLRRVPDGVGALVPTEPPRRCNEYGELNKYGLVMSRLQLNPIPFQFESVEIRVLPFGELFHMLFRLLACAELFYDRFGYRGTLLIRALLSNVQNQVMPFVPTGPYTLHGADDFTCCGNTVSAERIAGVDEIGVARLEVFTSILLELAWAFWQSTEDFPEQRLRHYIQQTVQRMGGI